tara:strand:- start:780 stop:2111 length:1332 start_codon:yes stop_codon:yes gene_type:complete
MMKKVLLIIDHFKRDLRGIALIAYWLNVKYEIKPYITHTRNELSSLIKHKPDLILLQHVRHHHQREFLEYAKIQGTAIGLLLAEGFSNYPNNVLFSVGRDEYIPYIDLFMPWGPDLIKSCRNAPLIQKAHVVPVGSPRFDYHTKQYADLFISRRKFCNRLDLPTDSQFVLWMSSTKYANPEEGYHAFVKRSKKSSFSDNRIVAVIEEKSRDQQLVYDTLSSYFAALAEEFDKTTFLIKPHPAERIIVYQERFRSYPNVKIVDDSAVGLSDLIYHADVQLNWRCTTSAEAWVMNIGKRVIGIEVPDLELDEFKYITQGNDMVADYGQLRDKTEYYLAGGTVPEHLIEKRKQFIENFLVANDGNSAKRCAGVISNFIQGRKSPKHNWATVKTVAKYFRRYRFNREWVLDKRTPEHPKYIDPDIFHGEIKKCESLFGQKCDYYLDM